MKSAHAVLNKFSLEERRTVIRKFRKQLKLSQSEFAALAGIGPSMLSRFENGDRDLSPEAFARVQAAITGALAQRERTVTLASLLTLGKKPQAEQSAEKQIAALREQVRGLQQLRELQQKQIANLEKQCLDLEEIATLRHAQIEGLKRKLFSLGVKTEEIEELLEEPEVVTEHAGD